jgi:hypothetical protein
VKITLYMGQNSELDRQRRQSLEATGGIPGQTPRRASFVVAAHIYRTAF